MDGTQVIDVTTTKFSATNTGCVLGDFEENDPRKERKSKKGNERKGNEIKWKKFAVYWIFLFPVWWKDLHRSLFSPFEALREAPRRREHSSSHIEGKFSEE